MKIQYCKTKQTFTGKLIRGDFFGFADQTIGNIKKGEKVYFHNPLFVTALDNSRNFVLLEKP